MFLYNTSFDVYKCTRFNHTTVAGVPVHMRIYASKESIIVTLVTYINQLIVTIHQQGADQAHISKCVSRISNKVYQC